ncbi:NADH-cytochrome b5 reductase-like [Diorhabda sublineata]|uniref:NADH-cytochrome b5 reductase-like n=1 Tax=Diorhabda sublineata TaxID=1163346 RepID=UPI0024E1447C|nr:NADH-cytochrome b5 reductase-like [Diorhabda sublineata]
MEPPLKPNESDCCNSGCNPCILDVYEEQLKKYNRKQSLQELYRNCLIPTAYTVFKVINIEKRYKDALLITLEYVKAMNNNVGKSSELDIIYKPGQFIMLKAGRENEEFQRPYTPIPINKQKKLSFTVLIKLYEVGMMCRYIRNLKLGSETLWRGPYGDFTINYAFKNILFIAQGIGIAPFYSIIGDIVNNENCYTFLKLYFCCKNVDTIYLREELYKLQTYWNFNYEIFLSDSENNSPKYNEIIHNTKLDYNIVKNYISDKIEGIQILICGNEHFITHFKNISLQCGIIERNIIGF